MKKIYYLQKHLVKLGDIIEYNGIKALVTEELIELNPELFVVEDSMKELLDKAKKDYPIGTMFNSKYGVQKVVSDEPFIGIAVEGTVQINTDQFPGGMTIYTPKDGWREIIPYKFTTEDGVNIYGDMKTYAIAKGDLNLDNPEIYSGTSKCFKYFYHRENALAYIEKHREKTLEDYEQMLFKNDNSMTFSPKGAYFSVYGWIKDNEPKLYYTKILQIIADNLHGGRHTHIYMNTSYHINSGYGVNVHCGHDEGCVYFKSNELAIKARDILGSKIKYLFN